MWKQACKHSYLWILIICNDLWRNFQQILVRDCIAGLLANLSVRDFQEIEGTQSIVHTKMTDVVMIFYQLQFVSIGELNRAICWYLSCDRYWEDTKRPQRHTPWYLLTIFMLILFSSIYACYYIIWVCFKYVVPKKKFLSPETPTRSCRKITLHH